MSLKNRSAAITDDHIEVAAASQFSEVASKTAGDQTMHGNSS